MAISTLHSASRNYRRTQALKEVMNEKELQRLTIDRLETLYKLGKLFYIRVNSGGIKTGKYYMHLAKKGTSDFIIFTKKKAIFVELKGEKEKLKPEQVKFCQYMTDLGYIYAVVHSLTDLDEILKEHL